MTDLEPIRLCEWGSVEVDLDARQRELVAEAVDAWCERNALPAAPLEFGGPTGRRLSARQYVGVVEVEGTVIEIYPKLDRNLLEADRVAATDADAVMRNLLWILEVSGLAQALQTDTAHLEESPITYDDLFAYMMAGDLLRHLEAGLPRAYMREEDDIQWVRGKIRLEAQIARNWMRPDRIACAWDEFTANTPMTRLLKCACRELARRVRHPFVAAILNDCVWMLDEADDVDPVVALNEAGEIRWDRHNERYRRCLDVAVQLLLCMGYDLAHGGSETFVFLLDMNILFEKYALQVLEQAIGIPIKSQETVGSLIRKPAAAIRQLPDFCWIAPAAHWVADAKYKFLRQEARAVEPEDEENAVTGEGRWYLSPADLRQLTVYAEMYRRRHSVGGPVCLVVVYPYAGQGEFSVYQRAQELWNGSPLYLLPVKLTRCADNDLRLAVPPALPASMLKAASAKVA